MSRVLRALLVCQALLPVLGCSGQVAQRPADDAAVEGGAGLPDSGTAPDTASLVDGASDGGTAPDAGGSDDGGSAGCPGLTPIASPTPLVYVAPDGDDGADGSAGAPLRTLAEAASRLPSGGTVLLRGGVYSGQQRIAATGTQENPVVFRPAEGERPIFDGTGIEDSWSGVIVLEQARHVVFEGIEIRNCEGWNCQGMIATSPVLDLTIRNCHIHHMHGSAARFPGTTIRFEGNDFHDLALVNVDNIEYPNGGWPTCMGTTPDRGTPSDPWARDVTIRLNSIRDCWGEGIGLWYGADAVVEDNLVDNSFNVGIYTDNSFNVTISRNFVRLARGKRGSQGTGILLGTEDYSKWSLANARTRNVVITNNVVVAGHGIGWWAMATPESTYEQILIAHNTVASTQRGALGFADLPSGAPAPSDCSVHNNVFADTQESWLANPEAFTLGGNAWLGGSLPAIAGATDQAVDVAVPAIVQPLDAQPLAPLVGEGEPGVGVASDFLCAPRDQAAPTRGAFEK